MPEPLTLRLGLSARPISRALLDGTVQPEGIRLDDQQDFSQGGERNGGTARHRAIVSGELDGGEFSMSSLFLARQRGVGLVALPIFLARGQCHRSMYCHTAAPIESPSDLKGKRVTVHRYNNTVAVWMRALLSNEYGVSARDVNWFVADEDLEGEPAPDGPPISRIPAPASPPRVRELLARGELDAGLEAYLRPEPGIRRIVPDFLDREADYYGRTGVWPIFHTFVIRADLLEQYPWLARSLLDAFRAARGLAPNYLSHAEREHEAWLESILDEDPHAHRLGNCERRTLHELEQVLLAEGLLTRPQPCDTLFACTG